MVSSGSKQFKNFRFVKGGVTRKCKSLEQLHLAGGGVLQALQHCRGLASVPIATISKLGVHLHAYLLAFLYTITLAYMHTCILAFALIYKFSFNELKSFV